MKRLLIKEKHKIAKEKVENEEEKCIFAVDNCKYKHLHVIFPKHLSVMSKICMNM